MDRWLDHMVTLDPAAPMDAALRQLPPRWAVYLTADEHGTPVQLLAVKNLRASIKRRLGESAEGAGRRVDYRAIVRQIHWKRVDSAFESDLTYLDTARIAFPANYRQIVSARRAWFMEINPDAPFPRWMRTDEPSGKCPTFGPMLEKSHAGKLVETIEDLFDLCRYHNVLVQSPGGSACAYKDMGKCPAPCDGSVSMQQYRSLIDWSIHTLADPEQEIAEQTDRMQSAAGDLRFELAQKIRQFAEGLDSLRKNEWRHVRPLADFRYLSVQPGPGKGLARLFAITPQEVRCIACLRGEERELILHCDDAQALMQARPAIALDPVSLDALGIVARHLLSPKSTGVFLHGNDLSDRAIVQAYRQIARQATPLVETDDEGVVAELSA
ncbi:MAG: hypothetical protein H7144_02380 [Burkholderiales bacterium]|nr:hypothetical protein [Phycisphaerae bacterium]